jgi:hypothetical protein
LSGGDVFLWEIVDRDHGESADRNVEVLSRGLAHRFILKGMKDEEVTCIIDHDLADRGYLRMPGKARPSSRH